MDKIIDYSLDSWKFSYQKGEEFFGLLEFEYKINKNPKNSYRGYFHLLDEGSSYGSYWKNKWGFQYENVNQESFLNQILDEEHDTIYTLGRVLDSFFYLNRGWYDIKEINHFTDEDNRHQFVFSFPGLENHRNVFPPYPLLDFTICFLDKDVEKLYFHINNENHQKVEIKITDDLKESGFYKMVIDYFHERINQQRSLTDKIY